MATLAALISSCSISGGRQPRRPNIVLVYVDDLGWNDVGYHNPSVRTPQIDRLAAEGLELDRFYVEPTCSPTRATISSTVACSLWEAMMSRKVNSSAPCSS